jgi:hypothetical protein
MHRLATRQLSRDVVWHGHTGDLARLVGSADAYCTCGHNGTSLLCATHQLLADQHVLDHLAFARSVRQHLVEEEWRSAAVVETRAETAEWTALLAVCARAGQPAALPAPHRWARAERGALGSWVISLVALVVALGLATPTLDAMPPAPPLASWQTR